MQLNNDADKPHPFHRAFTFAQFSGNTHTLPRFSSVAADQPLPKYPLSLFRLVPKLRCFSTVLFWKDFLHGDSRINADQLFLNCYKTFSFNICFSNKTRSSIVN